MEIRSSNIESAGNYTSPVKQVKRGLTPRELIHYHINNPDKPISDEDIENLILDVNINGFDVNAQQSNTTAGTISYQTISD